MESKSSIRSLYVHFPFCETRCHYCDFYALDQNRSTPEENDQFLNALYQEACQSAPLLSSPLDSIFFGGGTPSLTSASAMRKSLAPLHLPSRIDQNTEWTLEANPSSVSVESLKEYRAFGVNRLSLGTQALSKDLLSWLGRVHGRDTALLALQNAFDAGFKNVSVDLMCGIPQQSFEDLETALKTLTSFPINHLSCYLLALPLHHRLFKELPSDDVQLSHLLFIDQWMREHGFIHYEISNFSKAGQEAKHNLNYWQGGSYLGLGPSAHSFCSQSATRSKNVSSLRKYVDLLLNHQSAQEWKETLTEEQKQIERWMLSLRLNTGFPAAWLQSESLQKRGAQFLEQGLLEEHPSRARYLRLTPRGYALSDQVIRAFI
jgi:oxygen-independent coproporphyrinogen III oxidase